MLKALISLIIFMHHMVSLFVMLLLRVFLLSLLKMAEFEFFLWVDILL